MNIHLHVIIIFQKHLIITFHLILPVTSKKQFSLLLCKRLQKLARGQRQLSLFLIYRKVCVSTRSKFKHNSWKKIKIQSFYNNILQSLWENFTEIFDVELVNFKAQCEENKSCADYNKIKDQLQDELKVPLHMYSFFFNSTIICIITILWQNNLQIIVRTFFWEFRNKFTSFKCFF